ncbi:hypothetical protein A0E43_19015 [Pectobacterium cacticida]
MDNTILVTVFYAFNLYKKRLCFIFLDKKSHGCVSINTYDVHYGRYPLNILFVYDVVDDDKTYISGMFTIVIFC